MTADDQTQETTVTDTQQPRTRAEIDAKVAAKWHARDCGCDDKDCPVARASLKRAEFIGDTIGTALAKRLAR